MRSCEVLAGLFNRNNARVKPFVEELGHSIAVNCSPASASQTSAEHFLCQLFEAHCPGRVQSKGLFDKRPLYWVCYLRFTRTCIQISNRCRHWRDALLQSPIETLLGFFPQIANVVSSHNCLDIRRKPAA